MKICLIHNEYGRFSGEEVVVEGQVKLLQANGHEVIKLFRNSAEISQMRLGRIRAFFSGIYSFSSKRAMRKLLAEYKPDIAHVHNVFPLISPSVLGEYRKAGAPIVITVHNYRLICPNGLFMTDGRVCEKCCGGREYWCILHNCEKSLFKSAGYAFRNYVARKLRLFLDNVTIYVCLTEFQKHKLIAGGFSADRIAVMPNMVDITGVEPSVEQGEHIGYVGRISLEKGLPILMKAAKRCDDIQFRAAGEYGRMSHLSRKTPDNFEFLEHLNKNQLDQFYKSSRMIVLPSICYEGFPSVVIEAMIRQKPVICSRIGGLPEVVDDGVTGLLFEPSNSDDLVEKIRCLWDRPELCRKMGRAGRKKALHEYSPEKYYERLMAVYEKAIKLGPGGANQSS